MKHRKSKSICGTSVLHVMYPEKFVPQFLQMMGQHFGDYEHYFFLFGDRKCFGNVNVHQAEFAEDYASRLVAYSQLSKRMHNAQKIVIHGLFNIRLVQFLLIQPWLLKKCYWVIWGGDLYRCCFSKRTLKWRFEEMLRRPVIRRMGFLITYLDEDVNIARKHYGAIGVHKTCIMYPSNIYSDISIESTTLGTINIQVGNSADPENRHKEIFQKLAAYKNNGIRVFAPLSYGDRQYAQETASLGFEIFGDNFNPMFEFLDLEKYRQFLSSVDIAVFNHRRQEGMGNVISLLGMGKKVFLREKTSSWNMLVKNDVVVFATSKLDVVPISETVRQKNIERIKTLFSMKTLLAQWDEIFGEKHGIPD